MHPSLWVREADELNPPDRPLPDHADVVVIGGGVAGVCTALELIRGGVSVALLEAGTIASRASGRNDGQVLLGLGEHYNRIVGQFGAEQARMLWSFIHENNRLVKENVESLGLDAALVQGGGLRLAETEHEAHEFHEAAEAMRAEDLPFVLHDEASLREKLPPAVGFHGAMELPGEAVIQPARFVRAIARAAIDAGADVREQCPVASIEGDAGSFKVSLEDGRAMKASMVVHCTSALGAAIEDTRFLKTHVFPFRGQIIATDPLEPALTEGFGPYAMSSNFCYEYFRMHESRFVVGGMRWSVKGEEQGTLDDNVINPTISANLTNWVHEHFPTLRETPFPHAWTGIMAGTSDGLPLLGALPGRPGVFVNAAFNGYGLSFAWLAGRTVAQQILTGAGEHPATALFAPRRFID